MIQVKRCTRCERFENSMGRWFEMEIENLVKVVTDPDVEIVRVVCPDCQNDASKESKPVNPITGGGQR